MYMCKVQQWMVNCCFSALYGFTAILQEIFNCSKIKNIIFITDKVLIIIYMDLSMPQCTLVTNFEKWSLFCPTLYITGNICNTLFFVDGCWLKCTEIHHECRPRSQHRARTFHKDVPCCRQGLSTSSVLSRRRSSVIFNVTLYFRLVPFVLQVHLQGLPTAFSQTQCSRGWICSCKIHQIYGQTRLLINRGWRGL